MTEGVFNGIAFRHPTLNLAMLFCSCEFDKQLTIEEPFQLHADLLLMFLQMVANKREQYNYHLQNLSIFFTFAKLFCSYRKANWKLTCHIKLP